MYFKDAIRNRQNFYVDGKSFEAKRKLSQLELRFFKNHFYIYTYIKMCKLCKLYELYDKLKFYQPFHHTSLKNFGFFVGFFAQKTRSSWNTLFKSIMIKLENKNMKDIDNWINNLEYVLEEVEEYVMENIDDYDEDPKQQLVSFLRQRDTPKYHARKQSLDSTNYQNEMISWERELNKKRQKRQKLAQQLAQQRKRELIENKQRKKQRNKQRETKHKSEYEIVMESLNGAISKHCSHFPYRLVPLDQLTKRSIETLSREVGCPGGWCGFGSDWYTIAAEVKNPTNAIAFVCGELKDSLSLHISSMCTHPKHQRKGLGTLLIAGMLLLAKSEDLNYIWADTNTESGPLLTSKWNFSRQRQRHGRDYQMTELDNLPDKNTIIDTAVRTIKKYCPKQKK